MVEGHLQIPPYVPYRTFRNFIDQLREGIPARIDRSVWGPRYSGSSGIQLMTALKVLELTDEDGRPTPVLEQLVMAEGDERRAVLTSVLQANYRPIFSALDLGRATKAQFAEAFKVYGAREGVLRKCENFFIQAAQDAGIELSQYILARRHGTRRQSAAPRPRQATPAGPVARAEPARAQSAGSLAEMVLAKYPDFDPQWEPAVQERWLEGIARLYERLGRPVPDGDQEPESAAVD